MSEENAHALFSPSGAQKWMDGGCPGSLAMESTCENKSSAYAAEGTAAHKLAEWALQDVSHNTRSYLGRVIEVKDDDETHNITVSEEMCDYIQDFVDNVLERIDEYKELGNVTDVQMFLEERVNFSNLVGKEDQFGTIDVLIVVEYDDGTAMLSVEDLKYGQGVSVVAEGNKQLKIYARAALGEFDVLYDITKVNTVIHMVRKEYVSEHMYEADELYAFDAELKYSADKCRSAIDMFEIEGCSPNFQKMYLNPGEHCQKGFCNVRDKCPALAKAVMEAVLEDFDNIEELEQGITDRVIQATDEIDEGMLDIKKLNNCMNAADMIEDWVRCVRSRVNAELHNGVDVPDYMLSEGRKGNRAWVDTAEAEQTLKSMRVKQDDMYTRKLATPTQIMKLDDVKKSKRKFNRIDKLIVQPPGKPSVVRKDSGKKPLEIKPVVDDFDVITEDDFDDLA